MANTNQTGVISEDKLAQLAKEAYMEYWCNDDSEWDDNAQCLWQAIVNNIIVSVNNHRRDERAMKNQTGRY